MADQSKPTYEFGRFLLDGRERVLLRDGQPVALTPKAFDTLLVLVQNGGHVLKKDELMKAVWPDSFVEEVNLAHNISVLRKTLQEKDEESRFIETVPRRGYRFVAPLKDHTREGTFTLLAERTNSTMFVEEEVLNAKLSDDEEFVSAGRTSDKIHYSAESGGLIRRVVSSKYGVVIALCSILVGITALVFYIALQDPQQAAHLRIKSIAVLPLKPIVSDGHNESLEVGMADTLITRLSSAREIVVRPLSAVRKYADSNQSPASAGRELFVDAVLDGSMQSANDRIRVTVRLTRVSDEVVLWSGKFDENLADVFTMQDSICARVTAAISLRLNTEEKTQQAKHHTENPTAYQLYLKGRYFWNKRTREGMTTAAEYFQKAINLDPNYALAYSGLADCYSLFVRNAPVDREARGIEAASRAVELDDSLAEAHTSLAMAWWSSGDKNPGVEAEFRRAIELNPNYATAHHWYANFMIGRGQVMLEEIRRAHELDPLSGIINTSLGTALYYSHRYDEAVEQLNETLKLGYVQAHSALGMVYLQQRRYQQAIAEFQMKRQFEAEAVDDVLLVCAYAQAGLMAEARGELTKLEQLPKKKNELSSADMSIIRVAFGQKDRAIRCLEEGLEANDPDIVPFLILDPILDNLRSDPQFADLVRRARLEATGGRQAREALAESSDH